MRAARFGWGTIYKINADGSGFAVLHSFDEPYDSHIPLGPLGNSLIIHDNKLFGCNHVGVIFSYDLATSSYTLLSDGHNAGTQYAALLPLNVDSSRDVFVTVPTDNAVNQNIQLYLTANEINGAAIYSIQVSRDAAFTVAKEKSGDRSLFFESLEYNTTYFARVKTNLHDSYGRISRFTTAQKSFFSRVGYPPDHAVDVRAYNLDVSATSVPGAVTYTIQLSELADFSRIDFEAHGASARLHFPG
ncbi:MAG: hypothetical protein HC859_05705 [Bacteroidia bacterium]|nr:hypothetical protein [Bacteroidia bacterium]